MAVYPRGWWNPEGPEPWAFGPTVKIDSCVSGPTDRIPTNPVPPNPVSDELGAEEPDEMSMWDLEGPSRKA